MCMLPMNNWEIVNIKKKLQVDKISEESQKSLQEGMYIFNSELAPSVQLVCLGAIRWDILGGHGLHLGPCVLAPDTKTKFTPVGLTQYGSNDSNKEFKELLKS